MMKDKIQHLFVMMFENRSFDHILGFSNITGKDANTGLTTKINGIDNPEDFKVEYPVGSGKFYQPSPDAPNSMPYDPPHEFKDTIEQLCGNEAIYAGSYPPINNAGFPASYARVDQKNVAENMKCFSPSALPIINQLAKEFVLCDSWFSSVPGPTWPNRFFLHAATSGGLDDSPKKNILRYADFREEFNFQNGHIFKTLNDNNIPWMIYEGDQLSQSYALCKMHEYDDTNIRPYKNFKEDINKPGYAPKYIFIEPCYGYVLTDKSSFKCGNSQHPLDDIRRGEKLLKDIYETLRNSPLWENSCLIITYDEHGGFFDHVVPPKATPPADKEIAGYTQNGFKFDQYGVRVPTIIISPLIAKNTIDHTTYDHTSILKTLENWLNLPAFTERDKNAQSFDHLISLEIPRQDCPKTLAEVPSGNTLRCNKWFQKILNKITNSVFASIEEISPTALGFLHLAFLKKAQIDPTKVNENIQKYNAIRNTREASTFIEETKKQIIVHNDKVKDLKENNLNTMNVHTASNH